MEGQLNFGLPKTRAGRRSVPLPGILVQALNEHLAESARDDGLVFASSGGGPPDLRHAAVALCIAAGATPKEIATRAGGL